MKRRIIIIMLILITLAFALRYGYGFFRLAVIRATINMPLPEWVKAFIWGW